MRELVLPENFYPILQTADWPRKEIYLNRPLTNCSSPSALLVAYAVLSKAHKKTMSQEVFEQSNITLEHLEAYALQNWTQSFSGVVWDLVDTEESVMLIKASTDSDAFSAGIICEGLRRGLHQSLNSSSIYVAVPDRFTIMAGIGDPAIFAMKAQEAFDEAQARGLAPLSAAIFYSQKDQELKNYHLRR